MSLSINDIEFIKDSTIKDIQKIEHQLLREIDRSTSADRPIPLVMINAYCTLLKTKLDYLQKAASAQKKAKNDLRSFSDALQEAESADSKN